MAYLLFINRIGSKRVDGPWTIATGVTSELLAFEECGEGWGKGLRYEPSVT